MSLRHGPAGGAAHHYWRPELDLYPQPGVVAFDADHMEPRQADQKIATLAVVTLAGREDVEDVRRFALTWLRERSPTAILDRDCH